MSAITEARATAQPTTEVPPLDGIHRKTWGDMWSDRSPDNKLFCIARDAARRLRGLADILRTVGLCATTPRHNIDKYSFLAETAEDIASALDSAVKAVQVSWDAEDNSAHKKKAKKKSGRRAAA